jgi:hypothetical protein
MTTASAIVEHRLASFLSSGDRLLGVLFVTDNDLAAHSTAETLVNASPPADPSEWNVNVSAGHY